MPFWRAPGKILLDWWIWPVPIAARIALVALLTLFPAAMKRTGLI